MAKNIFILVFGFVVGATSAMLAAKNSELFRCYVLQIHDASESH
jgi:hypothetical protein